MAIVQFNLRPATQADLGAIKALIREVGINPIGLKWQRFIIAENDTGKFIGCGQVKPHRDGSLELASIAVKKEWRRHGVARKIIEALQAEHDRPLWLTCVHKLIPFYEQFTFLEVSDPGQMPPYFRRAKRFFKLYMALTRGKIKLAVMVWQ